MPRSCRTTQWRDTLDLKQFNVPLAVPAPRREAYGVPLSIRRIHVPMRIPRHPAQRSIEIGLRTVVVFRLFERGDPGVRNRRSVATACLGGGAGEAEPVESIRGSSAIGIAEAEPVELARDITPFHPGEADPDEVASGSSSTTPSPIPTVRTKAITALPGGAAGSTGAGHGLGDHMVVGIGGRSEVGQADPLEVM